MRKERTRSEHLQFFVRSWAEQGIVLDPFQIDACAALDADHDVLVSAPTGSGKTVVALYAVSLALARQRRCVYTAPIKALSNQVFESLAHTYGEHNVGLLTGDVSINRTAPVLVITTEVLRNMALLTPEDLADVGYAVLDEVHYIADRHRGPTWEEVILALPQHVRLVSLSATIANAEEFAAWLESVRGSTELITSTVRPVPLSQAVLAAGHLVEPQHLGAAKVQRLVESTSHVRVGKKDRQRILTFLRSRDLLPAIEFIFSRHGCDDAVRDLLDERIVLTSASHRREIRSRIARVVEPISPEDRKALHIGLYTRALERGFGAHHAGMIPALRELTEQLMREGKISLVYATGTLSLGIDMPVRTVVIESLEKFNGDSFVQLTGTEYTQLIGRAGRRGRDAQGTAVVIPAKGFDTEVYRDLASGHTESLKSHFYPSYNTVTSLIDDVGYQEARSIMGRSFAQFASHADLVVIEARKASVQSAMKQMEPSLSCSYGDLPEFLRLYALAQRATHFRRTRESGRLRARIRNSFSHARNGHVYAFVYDDELTYAAVLSVEGKRLRCIDWNGTLRWIRAARLTSVLRDVGRVSIPVGMPIKSRAGREAVSDQIIDIAVPRSDRGADNDLAFVGDRCALSEDPRLASHPVARCPHLADHLRDGSHYITLARTLRNLELSEDNNADSMGKQFDSTAAVLASRGLINQDGTTARGARILRYLHTANDLLLYESLMTLEPGELDAAQFASWVSMFLDDSRLGLQLPEEFHARRAVLRIRRIEDDVRHAERSEGIERTGGVRPSAMLAISAFARGAQIGEALKYTHLAPGDFISACRRTIDLLGHIAQACASTWIESLALEARDLLARGTIVEGLAPHLPQRSDGANRAPDEDFHRAHAR
ncbi:MAG: DEAD/DEAH box helicase [Actinomycetaceae bacterium]|nr:DEAD/DEAH box helicase [Actinomycetaceae bacterium]MDY6083177.1 DEAD/DEAH box helicase [Actinomycetaceae bacterium]